MTWEQKLEAIKAMPNSGYKVALHMRKPGDWCVSGIKAHRREGGMMRGTCSCGATPQEAVEDEWNQLTGGDGDPPLLNVGQWGEKPGVDFKWNGYMWEIQDTQ